MIKAPSTKAAETSSNPPRAPSADEQPASRRAPGQRSAKRVESVAPAASPAPRNITDLSGRVAVVIGGTSGLGRAIAIALAEAGAAVVPAGRRRDRVEEVCNEVERLGRATLCKPVDVASRKSVDDLRASVEEELGRVDILVNAAGVTFKRATAEVGEQEWADLLDTNLTGMLRACQAFQPKAPIQARLSSTSSVPSTRRRP